MNRAPAPTERHVEPADSVDGRLSHAHAPLAVRGGACAGGEGGPPPDELQLHRLRQADPPLLPTDLHRRRQKRRQT